MAELSIMKRGNDRLIVFRGQISELAAELVTKSKDDPTLEKAIMTAAVAITLDIRADAIGDKLCRMAVSPKTR